MRQPNIEGMPIDSQEATGGEDGAASNILAKAASSASQVGTAALKPLEMTAFAASETFTQLQSLYNRGLDKVFPECPVSAFMVPTAPDVDDYILIFRLDEMLSNLESGIFVRPKIELWAARAEGYDRNHLGEELIQRFEEQFSEARAGLVQIGEAEITRLGEGQSALSNEIGKELIGPTLSSAAWWTLWFGFLPPVGLLLLGLGVRPRTRVFSLIPQYLKARSDKGEAKRKLDREVKKLGSDFKDKNKPFLKAVRNLEVRVHPRLHAAAASIRKADGVGFDANAPEPLSDDIPDVEPFLQYPLYLTALASRNGEASDSADTAQEQGEGIRGFFRRSRRAD